MRRPTPSLCAKLLLAAVALTLSAGSPLPAATGQERSIDRYRLLVERNIFLRSRRAPRPYTPSAPRVVRDSDDGIVLTGVARRGGEFVAFFESTGSGFTSKIRMGEAIGKGKVRAVTLDGVEYEREGRVREVSVGRSLTGSAASLRIPATRPASPAGPPATGAETDTSRTQPATGPAVTPAAPARPGDSSIADILERMRRRRERQERELRR